MSGFSGWSPSRWRRTGGLRGYAEDQGIPLRRVAGRGGVLITHPATMTHAAILREQREARGVTDGLMRLSVGIEDKDLIADLDRASSQLAGPCSGRSPAGGNSGQVSPDPSRSSRLHSSLGPSADATPEPTNPTLEALLAVIDEVEKLTQMHNLTLGDARPRSDRYQISQT